MRRFLLVLAMGCLVLACNQGTGPVDAERSQNHTRVGEGFVYDKNRGCKVWTPSAVEGETARWDGGCDSAGFATGFGRLQLFTRNGALIETYAGLLKSGAKTGYGMVRTEQMLFEGVFKLGKRTGSGTLMSANGDGYNGRWLNDYPDGYGEAVVGHVDFVGQWRKGCLLDSKHAVAMGRPLAECRTMMPSMTEYSKEELAAIGLLHKSDLPAGGCQPPDGDTEFFTYLLCR